VVRTLVHIPACEKIDEGADLGLREATRRTDRTDTQNPDRQAGDRLFHQALTLCFCKKDTGQTGNARSGDRHIQKRLAIIHRQPARGAHLMLLARGRDDLPGIALGLIGILQQLVIVQIVDLLRPAELLEGIVQPDHALRRLGQLAGAQTAVFQLSHADRHVEAFRDLFHIAVSSWPRP